MTRATIARRIWAFPYRPSPQVVDSGASVRVFPCHTTATTNSRGMAATVLVMQPRPPIIAPTRAPPEVSLTPRSALFQSHRSRAAPVSPAQFPSALPVPAGFGVAVT